MGEQEQPEMVVKPRHSELVPIGEGRYALHEFDFWFADRARETVVECRVEVVKGGRARIKRVTVSGLDLSPSELRHYPLTERVATALSRVTLQETDPNKYVTLSWHVGDEHPIHANFVPETKLARRRRRSPDGAG